MQKKKGTFQHSSFLAGGATSAAGRLVVEDGTLKVPINLLSFYHEQIFSCTFSVNFVRYHAEANLLCLCDRLFGLSGHYRPTEENFQEFKSFLRDNLVDLTDVKVRTSQP